MIDTAEDEYKKLSEAKLELAKLQLTLGTVKYTTELQTDCKATSRKLQRIVTMMEEFKKNPKTAARSTVTKLAKSIDAIHTEADNLHKAAENFGVKRKAAPRTKRRRTGTAVD